MGNEYLVYPQSYIFTFRLKKLLNMVGSRLKKVSNIILFCLAFQNFSHLYSQRLLKNEIVHLKVSENRISKDSAAVAVLDIDTERMEFEKNIDILFQKKEY